MNLSTLELGVRCAEHIFRKLRPSLEEPASSRPYYQLIRLLVEVLQPEVYVEIGVDAGMAIEQAAVGCPSCRCIGIDPWVDWPEKYTAATEMAEKYPNITLVRGWSIPEARRDWSRGRENLPILAEAREDVLPLIPEKIDILFLDGWHRKELVLREWEIYGTRVPQGGIVLLDDLQYPEMKGVWEILSQDRVSVRSSILHYSGFGVIAI